MAQDLVVVALFGAIGAIARYLCYLAGRTLAPEARFPWVTLGVNVLGCLLIGLVMSSVERAAPASRNLYLGAVVGFLGAYTTFSTLGFETFELLRAGRFADAVASALGNMLLGLGAVWVGRSLAGGAS